MGIRIPKTTRWCLLLIIILVLYGTLASALETGSLYITSRPSGATVYLDDTRIGETDIKIYAVPVGSHKLRLEREGYEKVEQIVSVKSGRTVRIPQALARAGGRPSITGDEAVPPLQELFAEFINPWVVILVILLLTGVVVVAMIIRAIPARRSPELVPKTAQRTTRPKRVKAPSKRLTIPAPAKGITLKSTAALGNYRILGKIAAGGMATIYKVAHVKNGGMAVLKVPYDQFQHDRRFIERFRREAELGQKLLHDNIIRIYEYGTSKGGLTYIAMEYLPGIDLREYLDRHGAMPIKEAVRTVVQVCRALGYAHDKGVIHRDIKPENIMLPDKKGKGKVVLMDFGVAHTAYLGTVGTRSTYLGTPYYMSPDQISRRKVDGRSDIYSLGVVFFEMLTGKRPFDDVDPLKVLIKHRESPPPKPRSLNRKIPVVLEKIVLKMLTKRPTDRYKTVTALVSALKRYMGREGIVVD
jgi:tRNA A-37 threonylcarbamoyl transferase component Bud32